MKTLHCILAAICLSAAPWATADEPSGYTEAKQSEAASASGKQSGKRVSRTYKISRKNLEEYAEETISTEQDLRTTLIDMGLSLPPGEKAYFDAKGEKLTVYTRLSEHETLKELESICSPRSGKKGKTNPHQLGGKLDSKKAEKAYRKYFSTLTKVCKSASKIKASKAEKQLKKLKSQLDAACPASDLDLITKHLHTHPDENTKFIKLIDDFKSDFSSIMEELTEQSSQAGQDGAVSAAEELLDEITRFEIIAKHL